MNIHRFCIAIFLSALVLMPSGVFAAADLEVAGWIPYWRDSEGIKNAKRHLESIDVVLPFVYVVQGDGSVKDMGGMRDREWKQFIARARKAGVEVIPTAMWSDGYSIHTVLGDAVSRERHIAALTHLVSAGKYDGIDIDYENKRAETYEHFGVFLKELKKRLGTKTLSCTIEPRTPPDSLYREVPAVIEYANDYAAIAKWCDRVQIMAYDQQRADIKLNEAKAGEPYFPVSDVDWVRKVVEFALKDIPKEKIVLGIPSYGYHYTVTTAPNWYKNYERIGALNLPDILDLAREYRARPSRNRAGEMSFTYLPKDGGVRFPKRLTIPKGTQSGNKIAAQALAYANKTGEEVRFNIVWYSDAGAMAQKIDLAREYKLKGVALFKIDGEEDQNVWNELR